MMINPPFEQMGTDYESICHITSLQNRCYRGPCVGYYIRMICLYWNSCYWSEVFIKLTTFQHKGSKEMVTFFSFFSAQRQVEKVSVILSLFFFYFLSIIIRSETCFLHDRHYHVELHDVYTNQKCFCHNTEIQCTILNRLEMVFRLVAKSWKRAVFARNNGLFWNKYLSWCTFQVCIFLTTAMLYQECHCLVYWNLSWKHLWCIPFNKCNNNYYY